MPDLFWTAFTAVLAANAATILVVSLFLLDRSYPPPGKTGVKLLDRVLDASARTVSLLFLLVFLGGMAYAFYFFALDILRIWGLRE